MKRAAWISVAAFALLFGAYSDHTEAAYCGADSYNCCPTETCGLWGRFGVAKRRCCPKFETVKEVVWKTEEYCCPVTVYDTCCEQVRVPCTRTVQKTCYRQEKYTVCRPEYKTCYRTEYCTVRRPVYRTCYRTETCTIRKPVYKTCYRDHCYTVCRPVTKTCYRTVCQTYCKPVYQTCYKEVCCTSYKLHTQTCYRDVCYTVCKPVVDTKWVPVCTGEWKTIRERVPGCCTTHACTTPNCCPDAGCDDECAEWRTMRQLHNLSSLPLPGTHTLPRLYNLPQGLVPQGGNAEGLLRAV